MTDIFLIVLVVSSIHFGQASIVIDKCHCKTASFESEGCFRDDTRNKRLLKNVLLNERVTDMKNYGNHLMDWYQYLPGFICRCATEAKRRGFDVFGIEYYDQCGINFNKIGCFKENPANPLLNVNIFTDRDPEKPTWSGKYLKFPNWYEYLPGLLCRCTEKTQKKEWKIFAIRKWGECWSGPYAERSFYSSGFSYDCHNQCFHKCRSEDASCSGRISTNTIYRIVDDQSEGGSGQQYDAMSVE